METPGGLNSVACARIPVYLIGFVSAVLCYWHVTVNETSSSLSTIRLTEIYGFIAAAGLYLALVVSPIYTAFPGLPGRGLLQGARRAIGVTACAFAALHSCIGFLGLLGGWEGLSFLGPARLVDVILSSCALMILCALALTSSNRAQTSLGVRWRHLHRLIYLSGGLTLLHMIAVGSHFLKWRAPAFIVMGMVLSLLVLEGMRLSRHMAERNGR